MSDFLKQSCSSRPAGHETPLVLSRSGLATVSKHGSVLTAAIIGMARTGLAVAEVLTDLGARVVLYDNKDASELTEALSTAAALGAEAHPGTDRPDLTGVDLVIPSPAIPATHPLFADALARGVEVASEIELAYRISKAPIIAVTGTNGKTTTTIMTGRMLQADGREAYIAGNVSAGEIKLPLVMAAHKASSDSVIVAEVSTFQLEWVRTFRPRVAMLLNATSDHLDRHGTVEEYRRLKARIFENQTSDDIAVINAEDPFAASLAPKLKGKVLQFARKSEVREGGFVRGDDLIVRLDGLESIICKRSDIPLRGDHNIGNALAAACAVVALGAKPESIGRALREFAPVDHRLESIAVIDGVEYINNSMCTNIAAAVASIEAIDEPQIVIAGGKAKANEDYNPVGEALRRKAKHAVLIGADRDTIRRAAEKAGFGAISEAESMQEAVEIARRLAVPGDVVVLTPGCASFDMFGSFEHRGDTFKDVVRRMQR